MNSGGNSGELKTAVAVIEALGGTRAVADIFGERYGVVWNWRERGFPADTYAVMRRALKRKKMCAPDALWKQRISTLEQN